MTAAQKQQQFRVALCFALVYVFWGSTYLAIGIAGLAVLLWPDLRNTTGERAKLLAAGVLLFGSLSWTVGSIISRRSKLSIGPFAATGWEMTIAGAANLLISLAIGDLHKAVW